MQFIGKYKKEIGIALLLIAAYFFLRLLFLTKLPIFTDEAIYIRWAQIALHDASWRFISLTDGKGPFFIWAMFPFLKFLEDPLLAGRLLSVMSGFVTFIGMWFLTKELFKSRTTAFFAALLYVLYPMAVVYDRMALYDSMVATFAIWALYFSVLLVRHIRLDIAYTLGTITGAGILTKANANFSLILLPLTLLLFDTKHKQKWKRFVQWILLAVFAVIIAQGLYALQRLSPLYGVINEKTATFVYPLSQWIHHPFSVFSGNFFSGLLPWLITYLTPGYIFLIIVGLLSKRFWKEKIVLFGYFFIPFVALAFFGEIIFPRFIFFMSLMLLPIAAFGISVLIDVLYTILFKQKKNSVMYNALIAVILVIVLFYTALVSITFVVNPAHAAIPDADKNQYVTDWPSGWGVKESVNFFASQAQNQKIYIATEGTFGLLPESFEMYFYNNPNVTVKGYWPINGTIPAAVEDAAKTMPTYFVFYQPCPSCTAVGSPPATWHMQEVLRVHPEIGTANFVVYQVK